MFEAIVALQIKSSKKTRTSWWAILCKKATAPQRFFPLNGEQREDVIQYGSVHKGSPVQICEMTVILHPALLESYIRLWGTYSHKDGGTLKKDNRDMQGSVGGNFWGKRKWPDFNFYNLANQTLRRDNHNLQKSKGWNPTEGKEILGVGVRAGGLECKTARDGMKSGEELSRLAIKPNFVPVRCVMLWKSPHGSARSPITWNQTVPGTPGTILHWPQEEVTGEAGGSFLFLTFMIL